MCQLHKSHLAEGVSMGTQVHVLAIGLMAGLVSVAQASPISPAQGVPTQLLQPISQWESIPSDVRCSVERSYGDSAKPTVLGVHESISAESFELIVAGIGKGAPILQELAGGINLRGDSIKRWSLHFVNSKGGSIDKFGLTSPEMSKVASAEVISFHADGALDQSFALTGLADALRQLDQCTARLRQEWRVDEPDSEVGIKGPRDDIRTPFARAAPAWSQLHMRPGIVQFIVLVDETGKIADCDVKETAGAPLLEELGCELIKGETKAVPARDRSGKGVKDSFPTPPVMLR